MKIKSENRYTTWYSDVFGDKLNKLYELQGNASGENLQKIEWTISVIESFIYNCEEFDVVKTQGLDARLEYEANMLKTYSPFLEFIEPIVLSSWVKEQFRYVNFPKLTLDDYYGVIHDFYKEALDKELFAIFRMMFKKRKKLVHTTNLRDNNFYPASFYLPYYREVHIRLKNISSIKGLVDGAHEYGHGIQYLSNYRPEIFEHNYMFIEIVSKFFELLSLDYYKSVREFNKSAHDYEAAEFNEIKFGSKMVIMEQYILNLWEEWKHDNQSNIIKKLTEVLKDFLIDSEIKEISLELMLDENLSFEFIYDFAYVIAIELFMLYKSDRDLALYTLKRLMTIDLRLPQDEYFNEIISLGISPNENLEEYKKHIILPNSVIF